MYTPASLGCIDGVGSGNDGISSCLDEAGSIEGVSSCIDGTSNCLDGVSNCIVKLLGSVGAPGSCTGTAGFSNCPDGVCKQNIYRFARPLYEATADCRRRQCHRISSASGERPSRQEARPREPQPDRLPGGGRRGVLGILFRVPLPERSAQAKKTSLLRLHVDWDEKSNCRAGFPVL